MYLADITYGMTVHPWRKILDQCFVTRRDAYTQCGGLQEEYGHFGEWVLAASYHEHGLVIGYLPEARFHHHYIGVLSELREFTLDFVRGEINFLSGDPSRPGRHLIEIPEEWIRRGSHDRQLARALLRISLRECWRDVAGLPGHLSAAMRWLAPALLGDRLSRTGALINVMSSQVAARLASLFGSKQKLSEAFKAYLAALIHRQRLCSIADERAAKRYDPDRTSCHRIMRASIPSRPIRANVFGGARPRRCCGLTCPRAKLASASTVCRYAARSPTESRDSISMESGSPIAM